MFAMIKKIFVILVYTLSISLISCNILDNDEYLFHQWASVNKIEVISNSSGIVNFKINLTIPTPCNEYHTREFYVTNDTVFIKYYSKIKKEIVCIQVLGQIEIQDSFRLTSGKSYFFKFYRIGNSTLDTLIYIN